MWVSRGGRPPIGDILVAVGLLTRPAAALAAFTMAVALYRHRVDPFAKSELALLYFVVLVAIVVRGPGRYSIDATRGGRGS